MARAPDMDTTGVAAAREDAGPLDGPLRVARRADRPGHREVWLGEGPTWDAFVLAAAAGAGARGGSRSPPGPIGGPDTVRARMDAYAETGPDGRLRRDRPGRAGPGTGDGGRPGRRTDPDGAGPLNGSRSPATGGTGPPAPATGNGGPVPPVSRRRRRSPSA
ncbi:hypothetical protein SLI_2083 [Streptomyces lividans 1326]|uniref:Uncharacterized protein n=1 Tax=Streptomyces lividans 1326 TaxID=1200984 RepID=A0A7U9H9U0_STRLI|nr:hypothetical protein SLI_2083 [Streptomyces lividans 1326]